jgi:hypothetical protein
MPTSLQNGAALKAKPEGRNALKATEGSVLTSEG